jgi:signal transduction histidine kinase/ActR/RegA family two-component response regulator
VTTPVFTASRRATRVATILAAYAVIGAALTLAGWIFDLRRLADWDADGIAQMPNNAVAVALAGVAILCAAFGKNGAARVLAGVCAGIAAATLFEHATGMDLGIDTLIIEPRWGLLGATAPGRMGLPSSTALTILGVATVLATFRRTRRGATLGGVLIIAIMSLSVIGYAFGADPLYAIPRFTTIALQTSTMLLALGVALVASIPESAPMRLLTGDSAAGVLVRRALPGVVLLPPLIGWLRVKGQEMGLFDTSFGTALLVFTLIAFLAALLWWAASAVAVYEGALRESRDRLAASAQALIAADRMKDEFLATLSHELRTPLTSIVGWAHILLESDLDAREQETALQAIRASARAQTQLVDEVLDVSRIITGKMRLTRENADLAAIVEAAAATVRPAAEGRQITLRLRLDRSIPRAFVDADRIRQVVWNLLTNALKFSPEGTHVDVVLRVEGDSAVIDVKDEGPGIPREFLPHVFERFRQADSSATRAHAGLGIGLALAKDLVELHGGSIAVESEEHRGSRFTVRMPLGTPQASRAGGAREIARAELTGLRVLYVDDRDDARLLIARMLERHGADVVKAASVDEALAALAVRSPDVVMTDIAMPGRDGYDLLGAIRADRRWAQLPVLALTAQARLGDELRASQAGFQELLRKPIESDELTAAIARAAGRTATRV